MNARRQWAKYPSYKLSGVSWLGEVPKHWHVKRLKYLATHNDEVLPERTPPERALRYVDISSVSQQAGVEKIEDMDFDSAPSRARRLVRRGDTIVSTVRTYLKAIAFVDETLSDVVVSTGFVVIRPGTLLVPRFLSYLVQSPGFVAEVVRHSVGVSYPAINAIEVMNFAVPVPPIDEQNRIAEFLTKELMRLDELSRGMKPVADLGSIGATPALLEQAVALLDEYRAALLSLSTSGQIDVREAA